MRLENKVAVITGGASGMGRATTLRFLAEGASVVIADYNEDTGKQTMALAAERGFREPVRFIRTDVAKESDVAAMIALAVSDFGRLDIVFNNAGVGGALGPVWDVEVEEWDYTFDVLAKGVFLGIKHAARAMKRLGRGGSIINTASVAGLSGGGGPLVYSAAKAAVLNLTRAAALQLALPFQTEHVAIEADRSLLVRHHDTQIDRVFAYLHDFSPLMRVTRYILAAGRRVLAAPVLPRFSPTSGI